MDLYMFLSSQKKRIVLLLVIILSLSFSGVAKAKEKSVSYQETFFSDSKNLSFSFSDSYLTFDSEKYEGTKKCSVFDKKSILVSTEKKTAQKREKKVYLRYLVPVSITVSVGLATYLLYSVRSN